MENRIPAASENASNIHDSNVAKKRISSKASPAVDSSGSGAVAVPGLGFEIGGDNPQDDEIKAVLGLLESFNHPGVPVTLGGQQSNSWGKMKWVCESAHCFDNLKAWLANDDGAHRGCCPSSFTTNLPMPFRRFTTFIFHLI